MHSPRLNLHEPRNPEGNDETAASTAKASAPLGRGRAHMSLGTPGARGWGAEASWRDVAGTPVHGGAAQSRTQHWPPRALTQPSGFVRSRLGLGLDVAPRTVSVTSPVGSGTDHGHMLQKQTRWPFGGSGHRSRKVHQDARCSRGLRLGSPAPGPARPRLSASQRQPRARAQGRGGAAPRGRSLHRLRHPGGSRKDGARQQPAGHGAPRPPPPGGPPAPRGLTVTP